MDTILTSCFDDLDASTLYKILRLRSNVFVVEQNCPYADADGRDTEPRTLHLWHEQDGAVIAYLRILSESDHHRIGRVCTDIAWRRRGLASRLTAAAVAAVGDGPIRLDAQLPAVSLYRRHGFSVCGPRFLDDGIPHLPMLRRP